MLLIDLISDKGKNFRSDGNIWVFCGIFVFLSFVGNAGISCNFTAYLLPILEKRIITHAILASVAAVSRKAKTFKKINGKS